MEGGGWRVEGGGWRVEGGGWRVEGGGWRGFRAGRTFGAFFLGLFGALKAVLLANIFAL